MKGKLWTKEEDVTLTEIWDVRSVMMRNLHRLPGRTLHGALLHGRRMLNLPMLKNLWSEEEDAILRGFWKKKGSLKIHCRLLPGRTPSACRMRADQLKLGPRGCSLGASRYSWTRDLTIKELEKGVPMTVYQLASATSASADHTRKLLWRSHRKGFRIAGWVRLAARGCSWTPLWSLGYEPDAPMPKKKSGSQRLKEYRAQKSRNLTPFSVALGEVKAVHFGTGRLHVMHDDGLDEKKAA